MMAPAVGEAALVIVGTVGAAWFAINIACEWGTPKNPPLADPVKMRLTVVGSHEIPNEPAGLPLDHEVFIDSFAAVEGWRGRPGPNGEQGIWQWTERTWIQFSKRSYLWAALRTREALAEQRATARRMLEWHLDRFADDGVVPSVSEIALSINSGHQGSQRRFVPQRKLQDAARVATIYWQKMKEKK